MKPSRRSLVAVAFVLLVAGASRPHLLTSAPAWPGIAWAVTGMDRANFAISDIADSGRALSFRRVSAGSGFGATAAYADPAAFRGRRIRFSVEIRGENALPGASTWLRIDGDDSRQIALEHSPTIQGTTDWTTEVTEADVPPDARRIYYGLIVQQDGAVHARNVQLTAVGSADALVWHTDRVDSSSPFYEITDTADAGRSLTLHRMEGGTLMDNEFGTATTWTSATAFRGRRVTVRAMFRTKDADAASIWVRAEGGGQTLALENNLSRAVVGTTGWTGQTAVLDFPAGAEKMAYGLLLVGRGAVTVRDLTVSSEPITGAPMNGVSLH